MALKVEESKRAHVAHTLNVHRERADKSENVGRAPRQHEAEKQGGARGTGRDARTPRTPASCGPAAATSQACSACAEPPTAHQTRRAHVGTSRRELKGRIELARGKIKRKAKWNRELGLWESGCKSESDMAAQATKRNSLPNTEQSV
eukprot:5275997-Pleurochrysis_carterae.AAC.2